MVATEAFSIDPPTEEDLAVAKDAWRQGHVRYLLREDQVWWRVVRADTPTDPTKRDRTKERVQAKERAEMCYASESLTRFAPLRTPSNTIAPAAYAATSERGALWEVVLRAIRHEGVRRVKAHETRGRYLVRVRPTRTLTLFNICRHLDTNLVAEGKRPPEVSRAWPAAYKITRAWAQALYDRIPDLDGIIYESHMINEPCIVVYERATSVTFEAQHTACSVSENPARSVILAEVAAVPRASVDFADDYDLEDDD